MSNHKSSNPLTRREALRRVGNGFGMMAFAGMLGNRWHGPAPCSIPKATSASPSSITRSASSA